jgi:hypothetical protein
LSFRLFSNTTTERNVEVDRFVTQQKRALYTQTAQSKLEKN